MRQYMRQTTQINNGKNVNQVVMKALQRYRVPLFRITLLHLFHRAQSDPQGPVYLWARREIMEQELDPAEFSAPLNNQKWAPVERAPISRSGQSLLGRPSFGPI